ncbi:MAG: DNA polymerase III subunit alpha [Elusimicrobia bacterium]|nr:DNA polymerase III subunit alpha [Elusimicrobiota bacterium]
MSGPQFVHLHNHSEYSLLDGTIRITDHKGKPSAALEALAASGTKALALTDHGNLYGALEFYTNCKKVGIKPIVGCEMYLAKKSRLEKSGSQKDNCHLTVLARNFEGYQNLMALSSKGFLEGYYYDPRIDKELLASHAKGLIVLSGCLKSEINQLITGGDVQGATKLVMEYRDLLEPGAFFLEIMDHGLEKQKQVVKAMLEIHEKTKLPLVATNDCHYAGKDDFAAHDARVCISTGKKLTDTQRLRFESHEFWFKSAAEMAKIFHFAPEAIDNTVKIAEMCSLEIPMKTSMPRFPTPEGLSEDAYLEHLTAEGLVRLGKAGDPVYEERRTYELSVIKKMGFSGYFLIVWDFIKYAKENGVPVGPGRGSGAGALICYSLGITAVDPILHKLLFERFLNPDRISMPDIDIDFSDRGRPQVIEYVRRKYGAANVAQIITFGSLGAKTAIRDVGRILDHPLSEVDKIAKMIPGVVDMTIHKALTTVPELQEAMKDPATKKLLDLAQKLEGLKRHTGVHAAGVVITPEAVVKYAPLSVGAKNKDEVTTQYDGDWLPKLGLLKMDFLGLRNLSILEDAVALIRKRHDPEFDPYDAPLNEEKTYKLLQSGRALGVFQLDSEGMRDLLRRLRPTTFEDISACIALYRPGPMQSGMLDDFVSRKHGTTKVKYDHPLLEPVLQDTYGCMVYQEQVMEISKRLAGFTAGMADGLRKAMGKKVPEEIEKLRGDFVKGCEKNKIAAKLADKIYDQILQFGGYGFNKSHTVAYGMLSFQTAYLKANYTLEYFAALLTSEIGHSAVDVEGKENKLVTYLDDAEAFDIKVLPPDVQSSEPTFAIEDAGLRFGLNAIKNVGALAAESIVKTRVEAGPFVSLDDLCRRVDLKAVNKRTLESLVKAGAMDSLMPGIPITESRARLTHSIDAAISRQASVKEDLSRGQGLLFGTDLPAAREAETPANGNGALEPWHEHDLLKAEREVLGFYMSGHPLVRCKDLLAAVATHTIAALSLAAPKADEVAAALPGRGGRDAQPRVRLAGMIATVKKVITRKGDPMARCVLEDLSGELPLIVFPKAFAQVQDQLRSSAIVCVSGRIQAAQELGAEEGAPGRPEMVVEEVMPLAMAVNRFARSLTLRLSKAGLEERLLADVKRALDRSPGRIPVLLRLEAPATAPTLIEIDERVELSDGLFEQLGRLLGDKAWKIESASS